MEQHYSEQNSCFVIEIMVLQYITAITRGQARSENAENIHKIFEMISSLLYKEKI